MGGRRARRGGTYVGDFADEGLDGALGLFCYGGLVLDRRVSVLSRSSRARDVLVGMVMRVVLQSRSSSVSTRSR